MFNAKKFSFKLLTCLLGSFLTIYLLSIFVLLDGEIGWGLRFFKFKNAAARRAGPGKVLVTGGSAVLFGVRSDYLTQALGRPVINLAVSGGFSPSFLMYHAFSLMEEGDTVLFIPEYEAYGASANLEKYDFHYYRLFDPAALANVPVTGFLRQTFATRFMDSLFYSLTHYIRVGVKGDYTRPEDINASGDYEGCKTVYEGAGGDVTPMGPADKKNFFVNLLKSYSDRVRNEKHGKLILGYSPRVHKPRFENADWRQVSADNPKVFAASGIETIGEPYTSLYPKEEFCNNHYHLNKGGARKFSEQLGVLLQRKLSNPIATR